MTLTTNLLAYYKMDESSGNAADSSGGGFNLTNNNTATFATGKINNALSLVLASGQSQSSTAVGLAVTGNFTIQAWYKPTAAGLSAADCYIVFRWDGASNRNYQLIYEPGTHNTFIGFGGNNYGNTSVTMTAGTWYHIVATYDGSNVHIYINNTDGGAVAATINPASAGTQTFFVGNITVAGSTTNGCDGLIDEVAVWTRALSSTEVSQLYNSGNGFQYPFSTGNKSSFLAFM
jgi:hypothetical protein